MDVTESIYGASLAEIKQGYAYRGETDSYYCLICGERFEEGFIYTIDGRMMDAHKAAGRHAEAVHGSMLRYLLALDKKATGVTDLQKQLIGLFAAGSPDAAIMEETGAGSVSTIRNHRFALKERAKQAKLFLAIMELMDGADVEARQAGAPLLQSAADVRNGMAFEEYQAMLDKYLPHGHAGPLVGLPRKERRKTALLRHIATSFKKGRKYKEAEVDELLMRFMADDYALLRGELVDHGCLRAEDDGSGYRLA